MLRIRIVLATLLATAGVAGVQSARRSAGRRIDRADDRGLPGAARRQRLEHEHLGPARQRELGELHRGINVSRTTLHPDFGGNGEYGIPYLVVGAHRTDAHDQLHRVRRRERSRTLPDPADRARRRRRRPHG